MSHKRHHLLSSLLLSSFFASLGVSVWAQKDSLKPVLIAASEDSVLFMYQTEIIDHNGFIDSLRFSFYFSDSQCRYDHDSLVISNSFEKLSIDALEYKMNNTHPFIIFTYTTKSWEGISYVQSVTDFITRKVIWNTYNNTTFSAIINYTVLHEHHFLSTERQSSNVDSTVYEREMIIDSLHQIHLTPFHVKSNRDDPVFVQGADTTLIGEKFRNRIFKRRAGTYTW